MSKLNLIIFLFLFIQQSQSKQVSQYGKSFVLVGGGLSENNTVIYRQIIDMAGGQNTARIGIIAAASADPLDSFGYYKTVFLNYGAEEVNFIPVHLANKSANSDPVVVQLIKQQTGFFFSGGDQARIIESFFDNGHTLSPAMRAIIEQNNIGVVVAGSSAGTACQPSAVMVEGGVSYDALRYGAHTSSSHSDDLVYNQHGGTGLFDGYILDTHFGNRGREGRLIRLLSDTRHLSNGVDYGIGVDENTALVITHAGTSTATGHVLGESGVTIIDVSKSQTEPQDGDFNIRDVYITFLTRGDEIDLNTHAVKFSSSKTKLGGHEQYDRALTSSDIFYGLRRNEHKSEFLRVAASVFDATLDRSSYGVTYETSPRFTVRMSKTGSNCEGWVERHSSFQTDLHSYKNMYVEITTD
ncbi:cyanophycinase [Patella vulgata]|uniref:cyanophycinase n=1 Tax=Patella vulgata TaxID=6465 RepID=UPI0021808212|nr:cyanophycinase [Patella vulgata]